MSNFEEVQDAYDTMVENRKARRVEAQRKALEEVAEIEYQESILFAQLLHRKADAGMSRTQLRKATRKYGSNEEFKKLWDVVPYVPAPDSVAVRQEAPFSYDKDAGTVTFRRHFKADWSMTDKDQLTFPVTWSDTMGEFLLDTRESEPDAAKFGGLNLRAITTALASIR